MLILQKWDSSNQISLPFDFLISPKRGEYLIGNSGLAVRMSGSFHLGMFVTLILVDGWLFSEFS